MTGAWEPVDDSYPPDPLVRDKFPQACIVTECRRTKNWQVAQWGFWLGDTDYGEQVAYCNFCSRRDPNLIFVVAPDEDFKDARASFQALPVRT